METAADSLNPVTRVGAASRHRIFFILVLAKLVYLGSLFFVLLARPVPRAEGMFPGAMLRTDTAGDLTFASHFGTWDAEHYLILSKTGYKPGIAQCAFYPLWPYLVKWFSVFTLDNHIVSGLVLANAFSLAAFWLFFRFVEARRGTNVAGWSLALLAAFPGSLFFQFIYSESLFFSLLMVLLVALEKRRLWLAVAVAFLLPLTRAVGVFCVIPLFLYAVGPYAPRWFRLPPGGGGSGATPGHEMSGSARFLLPAAPVFGWGLYFLLMWSWTGDPFEGFKAQGQWGNIQSIANIFNLPKFLLEFANATAWHSFGGSILDRALFVLLFWSLPFIWRLDKTWFLWAVLLGVVPAMSGMFVSFTRFAAVVFPFFIAAAVFLGRARLGWIRWSLLAVFAALHLVLVWRFVNFRWAG